jgi:hypothetical protein
MEKWEEKNVLDYHSSKWNSKTLGKMKNREIIVERKIPYHDNIG